MLEHRDYSEFDPTDKSHLVQRLSDLIHYALEYPDIYNSVNDRLSVIKRTPVWAKNDVEVIINDKIQNYKSEDESVATGTSIEPKTEIEVAIDILSRAENQQPITRGSVNFIDLTGQKIGSRYPSLEEFAFEPGGKQSYTAGYQWYEEINGNYEIRTSFHTGKVDLLTLQKFVTILDAAYATPFKNAKDLSDNEVFKAGYSVIEKYQYLPNISRN